MQRLDYETLVGFHELSPLQDRGFVYDNYV